MLILQKRLIRLCIIPVEYHQIIPLVDILNYVKQRLIYVILLFCVPVMDQYSPVAISIAMEIHWHHPDVKHSGIEPMLRKTQRVAHIIGGRDLVKTIKRGCKKCRILNKASIDVVMGPIQNVNLCIAPAFYACQIDIF